jgi:hypothetical protein
MSVRPSVCSVYVFGFRYDIRNFLAGFEVLTAVLMKHQVVWDITPCRILNINDLYKDRNAPIFRVKQSRRSGFLGLLDPEYESIRLLTHHLPGDTASHPRRHILNSALCNEPSFGQD